MSFFRRAEGVFLNPRPTFEGLAAKPVWADSLIVLILALIVFNLIVAPLVMKEQLELDRSSPVLKERLGEDIYQKRIQALENPSSFSMVVQTVVITLLYFMVAILVQSMILLIMGRSVSTQGTYAQVLSVLLHASFIDKFLGNSVRLFLALIRRSVTQTSTSLAMLFPRMDVMSVPYIVLKQVDFFQLWLFGIMSFGLAAVFKISLKKALIFSYALWFFKAVVNIVLGLLQMGFYR